MYSSQSKSSPQRDEQPAPAGEDVREKKEAYLDKGSAPLHLEISPTVDEIVSAWSVVFAVSTSLSCLFVDYCGIGLYNVHNNIGITYNNTNSW